MSVAQKLDELMQRFGGESRRERLRASRGDGKEYPDPTPHALALEHTRPPTLEEMVQRMVQGQISQNAQAADFDTFEEHEDFEPEDPEELPFTPYVVLEADLEPEVPIEDAAPPESTPSPAEPLGAEGAPDTRAPAGSSETPAPTSGPSQQ